MKLGKKIFSIMLAATMTAGTLSLATACGEEEDTPAVEETPLSFTYADFEKWAPDFQLIRVAETSGALYVNKDPEYTKDGSGQSLLIRPLGTYSTGGDAYFYFPTYSQKFEFDYRDFSDIATITFEFYNAEDTATTVGMGIVPNLTHPRDITTVGAQYQELPAKTWTTLTYNVDATSLGYVCDVSMIGGFYISFPFSGTREEEEAPYVYLDGITFNRWAVKPPMGEGLKLKGMEYLDFENVLQEEMVELSGPKKCIPEGEIVKASTLGVEARSGENVYKLSYKPSDSTGLWSTMAFKKEILQASVFSKLTEDQRKNTVFCMDIYNANDMECPLELDFYVGEHPARYYILMQPKQWCKVAIPMKEVLLVNPSFATDGWLGLHCTEYIGYEGDDRVFYIDNMRFDWAGNVKVQNNTEAK